MANGSPDWGWKAKFRKPWQWGEDKECFWEAAAITKYRECCHMPRQRTKEARYYISPTHQPYEENTCIGYRAIRPPVYRKRKKAKGERGGRKERQREGEEGKQVNWEGREKWVNKSFLKEFNACYMHEWNYYNEVHCLTCLCMLLNINLKKNDFRSPETRNSLRSEELTIHLVLEQ